MMVLMCSCTAASASRCFFRICGPPLGKVVVLCWRVSVCNDGRILRGCSVLLIVSLDEVALLYIIKPQLCVQLFKPAMPRNQAAPV